jgi:di/tripeptidase
MTKVDWLGRHPELEHGKLRIAFTPDEEIGRGVGLFDVAGFGADYAYTVDGSDLGGTCLNPSWRGKSGVMALVATLAALSF